MTRRPAAAYGPLASLVAALITAGCSLPTLPGCGPGPVPGPLAWVVDYGWHTEIVVPAGQVAGPLRLFRSMFPAAETLSFGFGKQSFMTLPQPGVLDFVAGAIPGPATVRVIPLPGDPARLYHDPVARIPLTPAEWAALSEFLWRSFTLAPDGAPIAVAAATRDGSRFFQAATGYSLAYTCNAWTVDALHHAGLPVGGAVLFASGAMRETATVRGACQQAT